MFSPSQAPEPSMVVLEHPARVIQASSAKAGSERVSWKGDEEAEAFMASPRVGRQRQRFATVPSLDTGRLKARPGGPADTPASRSTAPLLEYCPRGGGNYPPSTSSIE